MDKKITLLIVSLSVIAVLGGGIYYFYFLKKGTGTVNQPIATEQEKERDHPSCLADDELATYLRKGTGSSVPSIPLTILIQDKETKEEKYRFEVSDVRPSETGFYMYKCGFYVIRNFNDGYRTELWHYNYDGIGEKMLNLRTGNDPDSFSPNFRIDSAETYIALIKGWYGEPDNHALIVKDLRTMEDKYVIILKELIERNSDVEPATISLDVWGGEKYGSNDFFNFHLLNPERTGFNLNMKTGEIKIFRYEY